MGFSCGIVGLPNVGKSTIFNALTSAKAAAANFPFCTIEPNTGAVAVPDPRLEVLSQIGKSERIIPTLMTFVDIAGLIKGASQGEGLGNQFLGHIRGVDAIAHVVRCFEDENVIHVSGTVDPIRDVEIINMELILSDLQSVEKLKFKYEKVAKSGDKQAKSAMELVLGLEKHLSDGKLAKDFVPPQTVLHDTVDEIMRPMLTAKPVMFIANVKEDELSKPPVADGNRALDRLFKYTQELGAGLVVISGQVESEIAELPVQDRQEYLAALGLDRPGLDRVILAGYQLLGLLTFFTCGPKETHAWTVKSGSTAPQAAGKIHSDFERGFIRAEVISYDDYVKGKGEAGAREAGTLRIEGKEYLMCDGDIVHFRFNV